MPRSTEILSIRVKPELRREVIRRAEQENLPVNQYLIRLLEREIHAAVEGGYYVRK